MKLVRGTIRKTEVQIETSFTIFQFSPSRANYYSRYIVIESVSQNELARFSESNRNVWNINESCPPREIQTNSKRCRGIHNANVTTAVFPVNALSFSMCAAYIETLGNIMEVSQMKSNGFFGKFGCQGIVHRACTRLTIPKPNVAASSLFHNDALHSHNLRVTMLAFAISVNRGKPIRRLGILPAGGRGGTRLCYKRNGDERWTNSGTLLTDRKN